ncbi:MAG TPA: phage tail protein, partial [Burkholderiales bacterium]|nr:phage tail protein [Burkholderiales bacterium]
MTRPIDFATLLYRQIPEVFRERDNPKHDADGVVVQAGDLARLLDGYGGLLDALYRTIQQRYYDIFPDEEGIDAEGMARGCQPWVLPYIAQLLDARPISPLESGQRAEVAQAVAWRQRKGTPEAIERIADAVGGFEVEIQEGWRIVAVTPWAGLTLLPASVFGEADEDFPIAISDRRARHPGLPNGTVDFRQASRAVQSDASITTSQQTSFSGETLWWRQANRHGAPCFPGSFQDVSARTADVRTPTWRRGHAHPRRLTLHAPPFSGYFVPGAPSLQWSSIRDAVLAGDPAPEDSPVDWAVTEGARKEIAIWGKHRATDRDPAPVKIRGVVELDVEALWHFSNLWFDNKLDIDNAYVIAEGCAFRELHTHMVNRNRPVVYARACLFSKLLAPRSLVRLEHCTLLTRLICERLQTSDCILMPVPHKELDDTDVPAAGCIRYSRLPEVDSGDWVADGAPSALK